ncbi:MAG: DnaJ C-terminal domain-containing protein, partial [Dehalococcoidia bacterium]
MAGKDYYAILGVSRKATDKEIRQAYRRLARKHHPDVNPGDRAAEAKFKEINQAYEVLSDPEKRRKYDQYGDKWQYADQFKQAQRQSGGQWFRQGHPFDLGESFGGDLGSIFGNIFRGGRPDLGRRARSQEQPAEVTLEEAYQGTARRIEVATEEACTACGGSGRITGAICHVCQGAGFALRPRRLEVKIPAGVADGSRVRVAVAGGELYLRVSVRAHQRFQRQGDDLYTEVAVPLTDAALGGEAEVPTLSGKKVVLRIPSLTQNGRTFRLGGLGMPHLDEKGKGDLYAKVKVVLPTQLSERERQLFE